MNTRLKFLFIIVVGSFQFSCHTGVYLSNGEAKKIIAAHFKYPIIVSRKVIFHEKSKEILDYLMMENYIVALPASTCCGDFYATTEKGKPHFGDMVKHFSDGDLYVDCGYAKKAIKAIKGISIDAKTNSAIVDYIVDYIEGIESNEPVFSAVCRKSMEGAQGIDFNETKLIRVRLKYYDKGWQVEE